VAEGKREKSELEAGFIMNTLARLNWRYSFRKITRNLKDQSWLKMFFIVIFALFVELMLIGFFYSILQIIMHIGEVGSIIFSHLFSFVFFGLSILLLLSGIISGYATFFRSRDIEFLFSSPVPISEIVFNKLLRNIFLSSWAFYSIIIPFLIAYTLSGCQTTTIFSGQRQL